MKVILAEKPSVARDLAKILGARKRCDGYLEGNGYQVTWAFGHLVTLAEPEAYNEAWKNWSLKDLPMMPETFKLTMTKSKGVRDQFNTIKRLFKGSTEIICATDAGREGELIFRLILEHSKVRNKVLKRLWISSLTDSAIRQGLANLQPASNYDTLADAARSRSQADWLVGLNATRAYTLNYSQGRGIFSVGRVQSPVLAMIVRRDQEIRNFKAEPFWELKTLYRSVLFKYGKGRFEKQEEGQVIYQKIVNQPLTMTEIKKKRTKQVAPQLFDLTELQRTLNRKFKFSADQTLKLAQSLYEKKVLTYPRTDSRYLTNDMYPKCSGTLEKLKTNYGEQIAPLNLRSLTKSKRFFNNAKVTDHHAIIPTGEKSGQLSTEERKLYHEVTLRFIAAFYPDCLKDVTEVKAEVVGEVFKARGTCIVDPGWLALYGGTTGEEKAKKKLDGDDSKASEDESQSLPAFQEGESGPHEPKLHQGMTRPPNPYTEASILGAMETCGKEIDDEALKEAMKDKGLGTPATRASIIEILVTRAYIIKSKNQLHATSKGEEIIACLGNHVLTSAEMTGEWESKLKMIERGDLAATQFMTEVRELTQSVAGKAIASTEEENSFLGLCPLCANSVIRGKTGYGCSAWKTGCKFRFHEEQFGTVLKSSDVQSLLARGRLSRPRKLQDAQGNDFQGYVVMDKQGRLSLLSAEEKEAENSLGKCPICTSPVVEKFKNYGCVSSDCKFVIWKVIAGRKTSVALAKTLLGKGRSRELKGFKSKAGKSFSTILVLNNGKVEFEFPERKK